MKLIDVKRSGECLEITSHKPNDKMGYSRIMRNKVRIPIHRLIYEECFGEIPKNMYVMHTCDNPRCINPEHLALGTKGDNNKDRANKGRSANSFGENHSSNKLTLKEVQEIRSSSKSRKELAKQYNVSYGTIGDIICKRSWKNESMCSM